jgi:hypothetical protein
MFNEIYFDIRSKITFLIVFFVSSKDVLTGELGYWAIILGIIGICGAIFALLVVLWLSYELIRYIFDHLIHKCFSQKNIQVIVTI